MSDKQIAIDNEIIRIPSGSTLYGLALDGTSDQDQMGVCIEPLREAMSFSPFEQYIYRTATERTGKQDEPSQDGDLDLTIYGLRKFLRLAMQGNPDVTCLLYAPTLSWLKGSDAAIQLQTLTYYIASKQAGHRFLGYMESQRQRMMGERGQKKVNRPELEERYGYDVKYAKHILRLGFQGVELMSTGRITLPMPEPSRSYCLAVKRGEVPIQEVLTKAGELEREMKDLISDGPLRATPDREYVEGWMCNVYLKKWGGYA